MKCPSWLLRIFTSFLSGRSLTLKYKGYISSSKDLDAGAPQGTLLGVIFFIVKFNGALLRPSINRPIVSTENLYKKAKYMDDTSVAVCIPMRQHLQQDTEVRSKPLKFSERTGQILPPQSNPMLSLLSEFETFTCQNKMKVNTSKTKVMKFNRSLYNDFPLEISFSDNYILEEVSIYKLIGVFVSSNFKWHENTNYICSKAKKKVWL